MAVALLGLIEASFIARAITVQSKQHIDGNQEFIGQGLSNIVGSFFQGIQVPVPSPDPALITNPGL